MKLSMKGMQANSHSSHEANVKENADRSALNGACIQGSELVCVVDLLTWLLDLVSGLRLGTLRLFVVLVL